MASLVDIAPALEEDFPTLAHIAPVAMAVDLIHRIMYEGNNPFDTSRQERFVMAELRRASQNPQARIFKAMDKASREIVGYGLFRFDDGKNPTPSGAPLKANYPPGTNMDFMERMSKGVRAAHGKFMAGKRHVWWNHLMVLPAHQRRGIGTELLRYGLEALEADKVPIWLVTQMRGRAVYQKNGFEDVEVIDIDFSEYTGPYRGFGVHRSVCMVRQPGGVPSPEPNPQIEW